MSEHDEKDDILPEVAVEFSRPVDVTSIAAKGKHFKFQATAEETSALAKRYSVLNLDGLDVECDIVPARKGEFKLNATFGAKVVQACGVSLEPVAESISAEFSIVLRQPPRQPRKEVTEIDFDLEEEDFEVLNSNVIDVGELIAQHLSLEINPYPRRPDATGEELGQKILKEEDSVLEPEKKNPFDVLKSLKHKT